MKKTNGPLRIRRCCGLMLLGWRSSDWKLVGEFVGSVSDLRDREGQSMGGGVHGNVFNDKGEGSPLHRAGVKVSRLVRARLHT